MYWGSMSSNQREALMNLVLSVEEVKPDFLENESLLNGITLTWFQCFAIEHCYLSKGSIVSLGTGLGKTMTAIGYMLKVFNDFKSDNKIGIFFCLPESLHQISNDFMEYTNLKVYTVSGQADDLFALRFIKLDTNIALVISYEALYSIAFANWFIDNISNIAVTVFDEAHELSQTSLVNSYVKQICKKVKNKMALTATPITRSPEQVIRLLTFFDDTMIPGGLKFLDEYKICDQDFKVIDYKHLENFSNDIYPRYVSWTRKELGLCGHYHPYVLSVEPTKEQKACSLKDSYKVIKGDPESRQAKTFYELVKFLTSKNKIGLCYAYNREISEQLCSHLQSMGVRAVVVNGEPQNKRIREQVIHLFQNGEIDILITNLTMSLNLACDYLIFWQFTNRAIQMLGRCERGFLVKDLDIYLIITRDTVEYEQYQNNVFKRCKWLEESLGKDIDVFRGLSEALGG